MTGIGGTVSKIIRIACVALIFGALIAPRAQAQAESDDALLRRVEAYLNGITTLAANFLQVNHDGSISEGETVISRPGRMPLPYAPPPTAQAESARTEDQEVGRANTGGRTEAP